MARFSRLSFTAALGGALALAHCIGVQAAAINYRLRAPCRVSLAIYDKQDSQIRTLRNAEPQSAGEHSIAWDVLDQDGNPVAPGEYTWKLLEGQGLRAEYLFSLGISTRHLPWPGNHSGPTGLAVADDKVCVLGTAAEGHVQLEQMTSNGEIRWASGNYGWNVDDIAQTAGLVYFVSTENARLGIVDADTGERAWWGPEHGTRTEATVKLIDRPVAAAIVNGVSLFRYDVPNRGVWHWYFGKVTLRNPTNKPLALKLSKSLSQDVPMPVRDLTLAPQETQTVDLGQVVVYRDSAEQFIVGVAGDPGWELTQLEIIAAADRIAAAPASSATTRPFPAFNPSATPLWANSSNVVWIGNTFAERIQLVDPNIGGKVLRELRVPGLQDLAFTPSGELLVISGRDVCRVAQQNEILRSALNDAPGAARLPAVAQLEPVIRDLDDPRRLAVDQATGDIFIAEWGAHHQVRRYDSAYKLQRVFGREGGRRYGLYQPEDFYRMDDVAGDGHGGLFVVENWGARRTAHLDAQGKLVREWYGGQGYQQYLTQDPRHADRFWLTGTFNTDVIECEVDWDKRDWHVRAAYDIQGELAKALGGLLYIPSSYIGSRMHAAYRDLDGDGQPERLLWVENYDGMLLRIDEAAGRVVPLAAAGFLQENEVRMLQAAKPTTTDTERYDPLLQAYAAYPKNVTTPRYWSWADADGDERMQAEELRLFSGDYNGGTYVGGVFGALQLEDDLSVIQRSGFNMPADGPSWYVMKPEGYTKCGAPIWRYDTRVRSVASELFRHARMTPDHSSFEVRITQGEGYVANGWRSAGGHGDGWPSNMDGGTQVIRRDADGRIRWRVGHHAAVAKQDPGQLHSPLRVAGIVNDFVGIADRMRNPLAVWTSDGLYVGSLFDRRADDGLPPQVYSCANYEGPLPAGKERGFFFDRRTLLQYDDMYSNGIFSKAPNGDVFHLACGPNSAPIYRVTGWDELSRQQGTLSIREPVTKPAENGAGLSVTYYSKPDFQGDATRRIDPQIWFGGKVSAVYKPWPLPAITDKPCSAVWEGFVQPRFTEPARLLVYLDTGQNGNSPLPQRVRLWVDGKLEVDSWEKRDYVQIHLPTRSLDFNAGQRVALRLEYSCQQPSDELGLCWESPTVEVQHVPVGCLYPRDAAGATTQP